VMHRGAVFGLALSLAACQGSTGTIQLELVTAPGSNLLDGVQQLRITITDPPSVAIADRTPSGFDLVLEVEATGTAGVLIVEGFDDAESLVATGASPPFAVSAIDARIVIYMAAPLTIERAPTSLPVARTGVAATSLSYGFALAGGADGAGVPSDDIFIYNTFDHSLLAGLAMPEPRSFQTLAVGSNNVVYLFGGVDADNAPTGSLWRFDTNVKPSGAYTASEEDVALARAGASALTFAPEDTIITGTPPIDLRFGLLTARTDRATLAASGAAETLNGEKLAVFAADPIVRLADDSFDTVSGSANELSAAATLPDGRVVFAGGGALGSTTPQPELVIVDPTTGITSTQPTLSSLRESPAVAATDRYLVVAGGLDGNIAPVPTADIFDARSLQLVATVPCEARSGAKALALPNGQVAIVGGVPANDVIELFTPPPPE